MKSVQETNTIKLINIESQNLQKDQAHALNGQFTPFLKHCEQLLVDREQIIAEIQKIIENSSIQGYEIRPEELDEQDKEQILIRFTKKEDNESRYNFVVGVVLDEKRVLNFKTAFFDQESQTKVITPTSLRTDFEETLQKIKDHFALNQEFSSNDTESGNIDHSITCEQIINAFDSVKQFKIFTFERKPTSANEGTFHFKLNDQIYPDPSKLQLQYSCTSNSSSSSENGFSLIQINFEKEI